MLGIDLKHPYARMLENFVTLVRWCPMLGTKSFALGTSVLDPVQPNGFLFFFFFFPFLFTLALGLFSFAQNT